MLHKTHSNCGPFVANKRRAKRRLGTTKMKCRRLSHELLEARQLLTVTINEFATPSGNTPDAPVLGADGNFWFLESHLNSFGYADGFAIGELNPTTDAFSEYALPASENVDAVNQLTADLNGNLWFTETVGSQAKGVIGKFDARTHVISEFPIPSGSEPDAIVYGPGAKVWFNETAHGAIGSIDPTTESINEYTAPTANADTGHLTAGPDGNLWFAEYNAHIANAKIAEFNVSTNSIEEFPLPTGAGEPGAVAVGPDGNIYFTDDKGVGEINPGTNATSQFNVPSGNSVSGVPGGNLVVGPDGNLWFADQTATSFPAGEIATMAITTGKISEAYSLGAESYPGPLMSGPDGNIWFSGGASINALSRTTDTVNSYPLPTATAAKYLTVGPDSNMWFNYSASTGSGQGTTTYYGGIGEAVLKSSSPVNAMGGLSLLATVGTSPTVTLATFTDTNGAGSLSDYSATVTWGDGGSSTAASIRGPDANGVFTISGSHLYTEQSATPETINVVIGRNGSASATVTDSVTVADGPLSVTGTSLDAQVNTALTGAIATFSDPGGAEALADYSATIDWGDGSGTSPGTISGPDASGVFTISGSHTYTAAASATITISVHHDAVATDSVAHGIVLVTGSSSTSTPWQSVNSSVDAFENIALQSGKIVAQGATSSTTNPTLGAAELLRYNSDGTLDTSFGTNGVLKPSGGVVAFAVETNNDIVVAGIHGSGSTATLVLSEYDANGQGLVSDFGSAGQMTTDLPASGADAYSLNVQPNGSIVAVSDSSSAQATVGNDQAIVERFTSAGAIDATFGTAGSTVISYMGELSALEIGTGSVQKNLLGGVKGVATTSDGGIMILQVDESPNLPSSGGIPGGVLAARLTTNGQIDTSYAASGVLSVLTNGSPGNLATGVAPDGSLVVSEGENGGGSVLTEYNSQGGSDLSFGQNHTGSIQLSDPAFDAAQNDLLFQPNGQIVLLGSEFTSPNITDQSTSDAAVRRFNADGTVDTSFGTNGLTTAEFVKGSANMLLTGAIQADGSIVAAGLAYPFTSGGTESGILGQFLAGGNSLLSVTAHGAGTLGATEGSSLTQTLATFTDPNGAGTQSMYSATVDWGDQSSTTTASVSGPDANGVFTVTGTHTYAEQSATPETINVVIGRSGSASASVTDAVIVADGPLAVNGTALVAHTNSPLTGTLATFTDPGGAQPLGDYSAAIDWGDGNGSAPGTISGPDANGVFTVVGSHTYTSTGTVTATVEILHTGVTMDAFANDTIDVSSVPVPVGSGASLTGTVGTAVSAATVATFTFGDGSKPASDFTATIDWGDDQTSAGTVSESGTTYNVVGTHTYTTDGTFTTKTTVTEDGKSTPLTGSAVIGLSAPEKYVSAVFEDVLGRGVDPAGLQYWTQQIAGGMPVSGVANAIVHSAEYYAKMVIEPDYLKLLGRAADDAGVQYWTTQMQNGLSDQGLEADLVAADEFYNNAGGTDVKWIDTIYQLLLGRPADASGESYWTGQLAAGETRSQVAIGIAGSTENNTQLINDDYFHYLGRAADAGGLAFWLQQFANGATNEDVIAGFTGAAEYYDEHTK